ncbi:SAM-dependent methyltransferase [Virgibacillus phasianinus]|uniref:SAM-dependent methyltransferase n=1 Tax=Virgibacillus phasianinus TaxID=2017483 RepID=A0A220TYW0_9BACI|nr:methyltransferase domain-containing protein [Virgibacillus phasianinus]ASK60992.1 SAM-dependent methyltransferase [Virgibacillus phasianinus]
MTINFHDQGNKHSYTNRRADGSWLALMRNTVNTAHINHAADIGCGGGIYSKALADLRIKSVTGVDFSKAMIDGARLNCRNYEQLNFQLGNANKTGLPSGKFDLILERALIHHLHDLKSCFNEAYRLLNDGGTFVVQDRTPKDCLLQGSSTHIRGYIFSKFPHLAELEIKRRHEGEVVKNNLQSAGFSNMEEMKLWETRRIYSSKRELLADIRSRNGRSILHELTNYELEELITFIDDKLDEKEIVEKDRWTVWKATKEHSGE